MHKEDGSLVQLERENDKFYILLQMEVLVRIQLSWWHQYQRVKRLRAINTSSVHLRCPELGFYWRRQQCEVRISLKCVGCTV